jgi:uncharacterized protein (DUF302 family)
METTTTQIKHLSVKVKSDFLNFTAAFENLAGKISKEDYMNIVTDPEGTYKHIESLEGYQGLIIFGIQDHGGLFNFIGQKRFAKQYMIGNPLIAFSMTQHDIRAALYAPLKVLIYQNEQHVTVVEYDLPSDQFGQFGNQKVTEVGYQLNDKLSKIITKADE